MASGFDIVNMVLTCVMLERRGKGTNCKASLNGPLFIGPDGTLTVDMVASEEVAAGDAAMMSKGCSLSHPTVSSIVVCDDHLQHNHRHKRTTI